MDNLRDVLVMKMFAEEAVLKRLCKAPMQAMSKPTVTMQKDSCGQSWCRSRV
jgi:hypothetical protein